jgi:uncharacterized protein YceK
MRVVLGVFFVSILLSSCGTLETKTGGSYEERQRGEGREKMWGCAYSGTKLDYLMLRDSVSALPHWVGIIGLTYTTIDIIFSSVLDTVFYPVDYAHKMSQEKDFDQLCKTPYPFANTNKQTKQPAQTDAE